MGSPLLGKPSTLDASMQRHAARASLLILIALLCLHMTGYAEAQPSPDPAGYDVHEWGLIRFEGGERAELATSSLPTPMIPNKTPPTPPTPLPPTLQPPVTRKPLIYFHPKAGFSDATAITATVQIAGGQLREVWPTPDNGPQPPHGDSFTWTLTIASDTSCGAGVAPSLSAPPCTSLTDGGVCEAAEMAEYLADSPRCLKVFGKGQFAPVLLYNGYIKGGEPVVLAAVAGGLKVTNATAHAIGPLLVQHDGVISRIERLDPSASVELSTATPWLKPSDTDAPARLLEALQATLSKQGLTDRERDDFMRAWATLLKVGQPWQVIGFYDPAAIDAMVPLRLTPAPDDMRRVLAFTIER
jgi:hypothetical protein